MLKFNIDKTDCMGCAACYSVCPIHCISMIPDEEGFLYPIASDACINCKLCEKVCPIKNPIKETSYIQTAYAAVAKDYTIWKRSASGGAFSEIIRHWADEETLIVGAAWDGFRVHHIGVLGFENISPLCKSKYVSSAIEDTFIDIQKHLCSGKKAVFSGCPCQVDGLRHFLVKDYENLLTIDLICHGQGSPLVFLECLKVIGEQLGEEVISYEFRTKRKIIEEDYLSKITTKSKSYYIAKDPYLQLFLSQDILRPACGDNCRYRDACRPGDLTIADCRGLTTIFPDLRGCKRNYSTIVCNTEKGKTVVDNLYKTMIIRKYSLEDVIKYNPLFATQTLASKDRESFFNDFINKPHDTILEKTKLLVERRINIKTLIKTYIPDFLLRFINRMIRREYSNIVLK
ncbi:MAG: Coenzyme F420 hydrogenase/dehydrogenase, beta subunit C-terminal domain [Bacteroidales bacterium]|nr:Coenzyme F420 hydrogenase/dehydrogenase, beta subunit C-terminal domain [Bacteroidales bacterium]